MPQTESTTTSILQGEIMAIDTLFKRIAERGRRIRNQEKAADSENLVRETPGAGQVILTEQSNISMSSDET